MEIQKIISELREDTIEEFLQENLSDESKDFILKPKENIGIQEETLTLKSILSEFIELSKNEDSKKSGLLNFIIDEENSNDSDLHENDEKLGNMIAELISGCLKTMANYNQQKSSKVLKKNYFLALYEAIEYFLIQMGYTFQKTDKLKKLSIQLNELIFQNTGDANKLQPREDLKVETVMDMLTKLANRGIISKEFNKAEIQIKWINKAIDFIHCYDVKPKDALVIIDWKSHVHLADWLLFLKENYIDYTSRDNKHLLEWVRINHSYNGEHYLTDNIYYASLKRNLRNRKNYISDYLYVQDGRFCIHKNYM